MQPGITTSFSALTPDRGKVSRLNSLGTQMKSIRLQDSTQCAGIRSVSYIVRTMAIPQLSYLRNAGGKVWQAWINLFFVGRSVSAHSLSLSDSSIPGLG